MESSIKKSTFLNNPQALHGSFNNVFCTKIERPTTKEVLGLIQIWIQSFEQIFVRCMMLACCLKILKCLMQNLTFLTLMMWLWNKIQWNQMTIKPRPKFRKLVLDDGAIFAVVEKKITPLFLWVKLKIKLQLQFALLMKNYIFTFDLKACKVD